MHLPEQKPSVWAKAVKPKVDQKEDAAQELARSFKEARSVLDELERVQEPIIETTFDDVVKSEE